jgi:hypothetical protein
MTSDIVFDEGTLGPEVSLVGDWIWGRPDRDSRATLGVGLARGDLNVGGNGTDGDFHLFDRGNEIRVHLDGSDGDVTLCGDGRGGDRRLRDDDGNERVHVDGDAGDIRVGPIESFVTRIRELERRVAELED